MRPPDPHRNEETGGEAGHSLYTIGHSTHPIDKFISLLAAHRIGTVADVRSFPGSRRWPQFNRESLALTLEASTIDYLWMKSLGGRRHGKRDDSPHTAWTVAAFRSYADYADSDEFEAGLAELIAIASRRRTAIMCSEGLWWRCHRRIISDHMTIRRWNVEHIMPDGKLSKHELPDFASISGGRIIYDGGSIIR